MGFVKLSWGPLTWALGWEGGMLINDSGNLAGGWMDGQPGLSRETWKVIMSSYSLPYSQRLSLHPTPSLITASASVEEDPPRTESPIWREQEYD